MKKLVIIPTYNEAENASKMITAVLSLTGDYHLLVVDDASPDGTGAIVRARMGEYPDRLFLIERTGKSGLGTAYLAGFRWALARDYELIFEMDCDFSHNPDDLERLAVALTPTRHCAPTRHCERSETIQKSHPAPPLDVVVGSRYCEGVTVMNWPMSRLVMSYCASRFVRAVTGMPVGDATAGFVGYTRKVLETMDLDRVKMTGYGFQIEMKYTAWKMGFRVGELPIVFVDRTEGTSKMSSGIFGEAFFGVLALPFRRFSIL